MTNFPTLDIGEMLTYRRPHDHAGEHEFVARYILPHAQPVADPADGTVHAYTVTIGQRPRIAFCAHTDSVHNRQNPETRQRVAFDPNLQHYLVADKAQRDCLGADNAAGVYVLLRMIQAQTPGLYVFFRGEERGGIGSSYITENRPDLFAGIDAAIQFDRRGSRSIITHMMVGRTCSDAFAESLADLLQLDHRLDDGGSFTDTANLSAIVPECTNVSCGYDHEHSASEILDAAYLDRLADACVRAFASPLAHTALTFEREPGDYDSFTYGTAIADADALDTLSDDEIYQYAEWAHPAEIAELLIQLRDDRMMPRSWRRRGRRH